MSKFINQNSDLESQIRAIVKQSFPFAAPSTLALAATEASLRGGSGIVTATRPGTVTERFVWGSCLMGCSRTVG